MAASYISHKLVSLQEVNPQYWELDSGPDELPLEAAAREGELEQSVAPAGNGCSSRTGEARAGGWRAGTMWKEAERGTRIHQKTPRRELVGNGDKLHGGNSAKLCQAVQFSAFQAPAQWYASSPYCQWL